MRLRKLLAGFLSCAIAATSLASMSAASDETYSGVIKNATDTSGAFEFDLNYLLTGTSYTLEDVYGAKVYMDFDRSLFSQYGAGGGIAFSGWVDSTSTSIWESEEWGNEGSDKAVIVDPDDYSITTLHASAPLNSDCGTAKVNIQLWWGADLSVTGIDLLGSDGSKLAISSELGAPKFTASENATTGYTDYTCDMFAMLSGMSFGIADIYGVRVTLNGNPDAADYSENGAGGAVAFSFYDGTDHLWDAHNWENLGGGAEDIDLSLNNATWTMDYLSDAPIISSESNYANFTYQQWWGTQMMPTNLQFLGADGKVLGAPSDIKNDVNGDGAFDALDIYTVKSYVLGMSVSVIDVQYADANDDGNITIVDVLILMRALSSASSDRRIYVSGNDFVTAEGNEVWINGVNTPWDNWNDFGGTFDESFWDQHFAELNEAGCNATRIWFSCNGDVGINISTNGLVSGCTTTFWNDVDRLFEIAAEHEIYVMATLMSFDHFKNTYTSYESWRKMINSTSNVDSLVENYVTPFAERYADNPYLWSIDLINEPEWAYENNDGAYDGADISMDDFGYYFAKASAAIHECSDVLVTVGFAVVAYNSTAYYNNYGGDTYLQGIYNNSNAYLDFYSPHYYSWQDSWTKCAITLTPTNWGLDGTKPVVIGEFPDNSVSGMSLSAVYETIYDNGYNGGMVWTSNGVDEYGGTAVVYPALEHMFALISDLIRPFS